MAFKKIYEKREQLLLICLLETLLIAYWVGLENPLSRSLLLMHFGIFLIWQPLQRSTQAISGINGVIFIVIALAFTYWINWWLIIGWLIVFIGIIGGYVIVNQNQRYTYLLVLVTLFLELFIICIPNLLIPSQVSRFSPYVFYSLAAIPLFLLFMPKLKKQSTEISVDLLYAITASSLTALLAMGAIVLVYQSNLEYFHALFRAFMIVGLGLISVSWLLSSNIIGDLSQFWTRSLLNIGTPFEQWLRDLTNLQKRHILAEDFLEVTLIKLLSLPWVAGVEWKTNGELHHEGSKTTYKIVTNISAHTVTIFTEVKISGALLLHCKLLIQLVETFYQSKINEQELSNQAHLQAIHETGARITHDIKNLLQSMHSMVSILESEKLANDSKSITILKKQFPYFIRRLEQAVNKLQTPEKLDDINKINIGDWWRDLKTHYRNHGLNFNENIEIETMIPLELFNNVSENLVENAIEKRRSQINIDISINLSVCEKHLELRVIDTGNKIDPSLEKVLFKDAVRSDNGFGIGLLQARRLSQMAGYDLILDNNEDGNVCFLMKKDID